MTTSNQSRRYGLLLIAAYLLPVALGMPVSQLPADGILGLFRPLMPSALRHSECGDGCAETADTFGTTSGRKTSCDCPACRRTSWTNAPSRRYRWSHNVIWLNKPHSYTSFQPVTPYHQPTFGVHQACWGSITPEPCPVPFSRSSVNTVEPFSGDTEFRPDRPPVHTKRPYESEQEIEPSLPANESAGRSDADDSGFVKHQMSETAEAIEFHQNKLHANWVPWLFVVPLPADGRVAQNTLKTTSYIPDGPDQDTLIQCVFPPSPSQK